MSVRKQIPHADGIYFITFTCRNWLHLFEEAQAYDAVYKWFDYLKAKGHFIVGYVIMPNHVHVLLAFSHLQDKAINKIIGNGKRFMAYEIVKRLRQLNKVDLLQQLSLLVDAKEKLKGKLHDIFEPSFDWKECKTEKFIQQKLNYIHENPCRGKWELSKDPTEYKHSSAYYYSYQRQGFYDITSYAELRDFGLVSREGIIQRGEERE